MKASLICAFLAGFVLAQSALAAEDPIYSIQISTKRAFVTVGDNIKIMVDVRNATAGDVPFAHVVGIGQAEFDNDIVLRDQDGHRPPKTRFYRLLTRDTADLPPLPGGGREGSISASNTSRLLAPGESYEDSFVLNKLYELTTPGTYVVRAVRTVRFRDGREYKVHSNSLVTTVSAKAQ